MQEHFNQAKQLIDKSTHVLLTTHERTDGDDLGSVLALKAALENLGKQTHITISGGVPAALRFLPGNISVTEAIPDRPFDLLIISGCSQKERTGNPAFFELGIPVLNIDHHPDNTLFGDINMVDHTKSAVAELVYDFINYTQWPLTQEIALCLLTGIFTDTGSFMHSNTKSSTLMAAASLMRKGAHTARIARHTYKGKDTHTLKAWSKAFANTWIKQKEGVIYAILTQEDLAEIGNPPSAVFEGFVETLNKVPEAGFALFLKQEGGATKGSLRSDPHKNVDVGEIARKLGGGGHKWASGFSVDGKLTRDADGIWQIIEPSNNTVLMRQDSIQPVA